MESYINPDEPSVDFMLPLLNPGRKYPELEDFDIDRNEHRFLREVFPWEERSGIEVEGRVKRSHRDENGVLIIDEVELTRVNVFGSDLERRDGVKLWNEANPGYTYVANLDRTNLELDVNDWINRPGAD